MAIIAKFFVNYNSKLQIYHALFHSHINYCSIIWIPNLTAKRKKTLTTIQKKAICILHGKKFNSHTSNLFKTNGITNSENIPKRERILLSYKFLNNELPQAVMNLSKSNNFQETRTNYKLILKPKSKLKKGIMFKIFKAWNSINNDIRIQKNIPIIKKKLKENWNKGEIWTKTKCYNCNRK